MGSCVTTSSSRSATACRMRSAALSDPRLRDRACRHLVGCAAGHVYARQAHLPLHPHMKFAVKVSAASVLYLTTFVFAAPVSTTHVITDLPVAALLAALAYLVPDLL